MYIINLSSFNPHKIADSGQAFRFSIIDDRHVELVAHNRYLQIKTLEDSNFAFSCSEEEFINIWEDYFDLKRDYDQIIKSIDKKDNYLKAASDFGYGIRILKQETFETVISYIISQRRSIPSITTAVNRISEACGTKIIPDIDTKFFQKPLKEEYYSFPEPETLYSYLTQNIDFKDLGLGYRLPYVIEASRDFAEGKLSEELFNTKDNDELYKTLTSMFGVGVKVANCIMLFSQRRLNRFPIDVWIQRILDKYYNGHFELDLYPDTAGIMQQYMFYYERLEETHK